MRKHTHHLLLIILATLFFPSHHLLTAQSIESTFRALFGSNKGGRPSASGSGSDLIQTAEIRKRIPELIQDFHIKTVVDAPCGDFFWMKTVDLNLDQYIGLDIIPELIEKNQHNYGNAKRKFIHFNLLQDVAPEADLILCRDCLGHYSHLDAMSIIKQFKKSGSKYLLATTFPDRINYNISTGSWFPINLEAAPFYFPPPLILINENCTEFDPIYKDKSLGLWKLEDLPNHLNTKPGKEADWQRVYLATFPRSGNHWARFLIEEVTHIATGSVFCDNDSIEYPFLPSHQPALFPWGGYTTPQGYYHNCRLPTQNDIVVIKTHFPAVLTELDGRSYRKVIRIVRHPIDSFYSNAVYSYPHLKIESIPRADLIHYIRLWKNFQNYWNRQDNVYTVFYENLLTHPKEELQNILNQIGYEYSEQDIERALAAHPPKGSLLKHLNFFSDAELELIQKELGDLMKNFGYEIPKKKEVS